MEIVSRYRLHKTVGSPAVNGASGIETLASHAANPAAHPDYIPRTALPTFFSRSEHLESKLDHADQLVRRAELLTSKLEFENARGSNLATDASNYMATRGVKRHIVTAYVLGKVLESYGIDGSKNFFDAGKIVTSVVSGPTKDKDSYVPSYGLFYPIYAKVIEWMSKGGISDTYLSKAEAETTYVKQDAYDIHTHDIMSNNGMPAATDYMLTTDETYKTRKNYYTYDKVTHTFSLLETTAYIVGDPIPDNTVYEDVVSQSDLDDVKSRQGYAFTNDATFKDGTIYYKWSTATRMMVIATDYEVGEPVPANTYYEKVCLASQASSSTGKSHLPDWEKNVEVTATAGTCEWRFIVPKVGGNDVTGYISFSLAISAPSTGYVRVAVSPDSGTTWKPLVNIFATYSDSSHAGNRIASVAMTAIRAKSGQEFKVFAVDGMGAQLTSGVYVDGYIPTIGYFTPDTAE